MYTSIQISVPPQNSIPPRSFQSKLSHFQVEILLSACIFSWTILVSPLFRLDSSKYCNESINMLSRMAQVINNGGFAYNFERSRDGILI